MSRRVNGLTEIASDYKAILCDVWGVVHNGERVYTAAVEALAQFRAEGGRVVLLTNSPRRNQGVAAQLAEMGVADGTYDSIVTSGDVTRDLISNGGKSVFHLGPDRDLPLFEGLDVEMVGEAECNSIVCTGLNEDEVETPEDYTDQLKELAARNVPFICANPDLIVERGERLIYCAGSLAKLYEELGGQVRVAGKPHQPIYELAMRKLEDHAGAKIDRSAVVAIGDGMPTDVAGAQNNGFDLLYISGGIHSADYGTVDDPDETRLNAFLEQHNASPVAWIPRLEWGQD